MTLDEARKIAAIVATADGGCSVCVGDLVEQLRENFPQFKWTHHEPDKPLGPKEWKEWNDRFPEKVAVEEAS